MLHDLQVFNIGKKGQAGEDSRGSEHNKARSSSTSRIWILKFKKSRTSQKYGFEKNFEESDVILCWKPEKNPDPQISK